MASGQEHCAYWEKQAASVRRRVNLAWWLEGVSAPLVVLALVGAAALLWIRREYPAVPSGWMFAVVLSSPVILGGAILWRVWKKFENTQDSLVRIEAALCLRNALSAAQAGISPWPAPVAKVDAGLRWQWTRLFVPLIGALSLLAAGLWIPVKVKSPRESLPAAQPQAWEKLSSGLEELRKEEVVDTKYLEETQKRLDELKAQKEEQWFSHASLEATDSLKKSHYAEMARMNQNLGKAEQALNAMEAHISGGEAEKERQMDEFQQALQNLQNGAMKPNPELLAQMQKLGAGDLSEMSPEQLQQLRENLKKHKEALENAEGEGEDGDMEGAEDGDGNGEDGNGEDGDGDGDKPGRGGVNRGPGHDPKVLGKGKPQEEIGNAERLEAKDLSRAMPGDLLELQQRKHEVDTSPSRPDQGGNTEATGQGGDRVWKESLNPDEQRAMKRFFE